jgi:hypothetical protein
MPDGGLVGQHKAKFVEWSEFDHGFRCACGHTARDFRTYAMAVDAMNKHRADMERIRMLTQGRGQTLEQAHRYYAEQAANTSLDTETREQWRRLADEAGHRLGLDSREVQEELFTL